MINRKRGVVSVFSVDVEDGVSIAMRNVFGKVIPQTQRVLHATEKILGLLEKHNTIGTFFILGKVAEDFPKLVRRIAKEGHELGVHGYNHLVFNKMTSALAQEELSSAKKLLEDLSGAPVLGHRAPAFSISPKTPWAFDVLSSCGFTYDSSIMPIKAKRYGWPNFPYDPCEVIDEFNNSIIEVPIRPMQFLGKSIPYSGGSYLRLLPFSAVKLGFSKNPDKSILYIHPYELDTSRYPKEYFDELEKQSWLTQLKMRSMWINRGNTYSKLDQLLSRYSFSSMSNFISSYQEVYTFEKYSLKDLLESKGTPKS